MGKGRVTAGTKRSSKFDIRSSRKQSPGRPSANIERRTSNLASMVFRMKLGWMGLAASAKGLCDVVLPKSSRRAVERALAGRQRSTFEVQGLGNGRGTSGQREGNAHPRISNVEWLLYEVRQQIAAYLAGKRQSFEVPLDLSWGTPFQRRVWRVARRIPYGRARSYGWIASRLGGRRYARAVGAALGANPVPLVVPCHRVLAQDGALGGFSGGLAIKRKLLELEGTLKHLQMKNAKCKREHCGTRPQFSIFN